MKRRLNSLEGSEELKNLVNQFCYNCYVLFPQVSSLIGNYKSMYKFILPVNFFAEMITKINGNDFLKVCFCVSRELLDAWQILLHFFARNLNTNPN